MSYDLSTMHACVWLLTSQVYSLLLVLWCVLCFCSRRVCWHNAAVRIYNYDRFKFYYRKRLGPVSAVQFTHVQFTIEHVLLLFVTYSTEKMWLNICCDTCSIQKISNSISKAFVQHNKAHVQHRIILKVRYRHIFIINMHMFSHGIF